MAVGMFMAILDVQVVATSLPAIRSALDIAPQAMSWIQTAYLIAEVISIPLTGWLTRVLTMRGLFTAAIGTFTAASVGCALAGGVWSLVAWRVLQGFAGGVLIPLVFSATVILFPAQRQALATTVAGVLAVLAPTVGPIAGGWITESSSWHWLFLINVAPGLVALAVGASFLQRDRSEAGAWRNLDGAALVLLAIALASLEIGLKQAPERGWAAAPTLAWLAAGIGAGTVFIRRTLVRPGRLVDLTTFSDRSFAVGCWLSFVLGFGLYGSVYLMPVFLAFVRGHGPIAIGEIMLVTGAAQLVTAPLAVALERRADARWLSLAGFLLFAAGLALSARQTVATDFAGMALPQLLRGSAIMLCILAPTRLALGSLPPARVPDASGLFNLMRNLGGAIGLALIDTVIFGRAPGHAARLADRLTAGDSAAATVVGIPLDLFAERGTGPPTPEEEAMLRPLVEKAAMTLAINEAWAMLAVVTAVSVAALLLLSRPAKGEAA
jgi:DHA2 family multidrug resistance protein